MSARTSTAGPSPLRRTPATPVPPMPAVTAYPAPASHSAAMPAVRCSANASSGWECRSLYSSSSVMPELSGNGPSIYPRIASVGRAQRPVMGGVGGPDPAGVGVELLVRVEPVVAPVGGGLAAQGAGRFLRARGRDAVALGPSDPNPDHEHEHGDVNHRHQHDDHGQIAVHFGLPPCPAPSGRRQRVLLDAVLGRRGRRLDAGPAGDPP